MTVCKIQWNQLHNIHTRGHCGYTTSKRRQHEDFAGAAVTLWLLGLHNKSMILPLILKRKALSGRHFWCLEKDVLMFSAKQV